MRCINEALGIGRGVDEDMESGPLGTVCTLGERTAVIESGGGDRWGWGRARGDTGESGWISLRCRSCIRLCGLGGSSLGGEVGEPGAREQLCLPSDPLRLRE